MAWRCFIIIINICNESYSTINRVSALNLAIAYDSFGSGDDQVAFHFPTIMLLSILWRAFGLLITALMTISSTKADKQAKVEDFFHKSADSVQGHTNNWAVLVCSSRYWFNYRVSCIPVHFPSKSLTFLDSIWPIH